VVALKGGQPTHPAWFHNPKANPETTLQIGSTVRKVRARVATEEERDRLWPKFVALYPGYEFFERNAKRRKIPSTIADRMLRLRDPQGAQRPDERRPRPMRAPARLSLCARCGLAGERATARFRGRPPLPGWSQGE